MALSDWSRLGLERNLLCGTFMAFLLRLYGNRSRRVSVAGCTSPHVRKREARSGRAYVDQLQEKVPPLARNEQDHRKNQAADTNYFESERTDNTTVRCCRVED